jgi:transcriptional regulator with XRE-family HTH domain
MGRPQKPVDDSNYLGRFAVRLRKLREKSGMTVEEYTAKVCENGYPIVPRTVYHWERARTTPPLEAIPAMAAALSIKIRTLFPES